MFMTVQVTPEERSLAAAMRWQDELASRGCLPAPERALTPLLSLANFDSGQLARLQRSDSKLLSAAAAAAQTRAIPPMSSTSVTENPKALQTAAESSQRELGAITFHDQCGTPLRIVKTGNPPSMKAEDCPQTSAAHVEVCSQQSPGIAEAGAANIQRQSAPEVAQLARLPSAKGHCLMSYASARPQSPMKQPSFSRGAPLHASEMLSVRPFGVQPQRPSTAAAILNAAPVQAVAGKSMPAEGCGPHDGNPEVLVVQSEDRQPAVLKPCSQPDSRPQHAVGQSSHPPADDQGTAVGTIEQWNLQVYMGMPLLSPMICQTWKKSSFCAHSVSK